MLNHPCIPEMKPTWLWWMIFVIWCLFLKYIVSWNYLHLRRPLNLLYLTIWLLRYYFRSVHSFYYDTQNLAYILPGSKYNSY
jgi:hypothetical protein